MSDEPKPLPQWRCEKSKSNRAGCKECKDKIEKDVMRLGLVMPVHGHEDHTQTNWYHASCVGKKTAKFFKKFGGEESAFLDAVSLQINHLTPSTFGNTHDH